MNCIHFMCAAVYIRTNVPPAIVSKEWRSRRRRITIYERSGERRRHAVMMLRSFAEISSSG